MIKAHECRIGRLETHTLESLACSSDLHMYLLASLEIAVAVGSHHEAAGSRL